MWHDENKMEVAVSYHSEMLSGDSDVLNYGVIC